MKDTLKALAAFRWIAVIAIMALALNTCASSSMSAGGVAIAVPDELDIILREASDYLNQSVEKGQKIAFVNIQSDSAALTEYVIDELIANAVNDRLFSVVDRQQMDAVRAELNFNMSGEVSDKSAQAVGQMLGAQIIITGRVSQIGERVRLNIRALEVETAQVVGSNNWNMAAGKTITDLLKSGGEMPPTARATATATATQSGAASATQTAANKASAEELPSVTVTVNQMPAGALSVNSASAWNAAINKIRNGGDNQDYVIHVTGTITVPAIPENENLFGNVVGISVTIQGGGTLAKSNAQGSLIRIGTGQSVTLKNVTLRGYSDNNTAIIVILREGTCQMVEGSLITGNSVTVLGGGVTVDGGNFTMLGGSISGNSGRVMASAGGVFIESFGNFTMQGGTISGNKGSGVRINRGTFTMQGGTILGNAASYGGGVYVNYETSNSGQFTKTGGTIYGSDASIRDRNTASDKQGHAVYWGSRYRNATAGPDDRTDGYGFWLND
jgi:TolB-like protein